MAVTESRTLRKTVHLAPDVDVDDPTTREELASEIEASYGPGWLTESAEGSSMTIALEYTYEDVSEDLNSWAQSLYGNLTADGDVLAPLYVAAAYHGLADFSHLGRVVGFAHERGGEDSMALWINLHFRRVAEDLHRIAAGKNDRGASVSSNPEVAYSCDRIRQTQEATQGTPRLRNAIAEISEKAGFEDISEMIGQIRLPEAWLARAFEELPSAETLLTAARSTNDDRGDHGYDPLTAWRRNSGGWWAMGLGRVMHRLGDLLEWCDFERQKSGAPDTPRA